MQESALSRTPTGTRPSLPPTAVGKIGQKIVDPDWRLAKTESPVILNLHNALLQPDVLMYMSAYHDST